MRSRSGSSSTARRLLAVALLAVVASCGAPAAHAQPPAAPPLSSRPAGSVRVIGTAQTVPIPEGAQSSVVDVSVAWPYATSTIRGRYCDVLLTALRSDGKVVAWGGCNTTQPAAATVPCSIAYNAPAGCAQASERAVMVKAGGLFALAVTESNKVIAWGDDTSTVVSGAPAEAVAVAAGDNHALALLSDGTVEGWGSDLYGQATPPTDPLMDKVVVAIDARGDQSMVLTKDGELVCWGRNWACPTPADLNNVPVVSMALLNGTGTITAKGMFWSSGMALLANGTTISWTMTSQIAGNVAPNNFNPITFVPVPPAAHGARAIAAGASWYGAIMPDNSLVQWGAVCYYSYPTYRQDDDHIKALAVGAGMGNLMLVCAPGDTTCTSYMPPSCVVYYGPAPP